jgi:hypothetical protein
MCIHAERGQVLGGYEGRAITQDRPYVVDIVVAETYESYVSTFVGALCATSGRSKTHRNGCVRAERNIIKTMGAEKGC